MRKVRLLCIAFACSMVLALAACAPSTSQGESGASGDSASQGASTAAFEWSADADCGLCHGLESDSLSNADCQIAVKHGALACSSCHSEEDKLAQAHSKVTLEDTDKKVSKLKKTEVGNEVCLACHESDYKPEATAQVTMFTDSEGTTINPHALPATEKHQSILCSDCHTVHSSEPMEENAPKTCLNCHHENVYKCGTCHE